MSRPYPASQTCERCGEQDHVAWILENEKGVLEATVYRCMWCAKWDFYEQISAEDAVIEWTPDDDT